MSRPRTVRTPPPAPEPGSHVEADVAAAFSCDKGLASFGRVYGRTRQTPPAALVDNTDFAGPFIEKHDTRYYFACYPTSGTDGTGWLYLRQVQVPQRSE